MKAESAEQHSEGGAERVDQDRGVGSHHSGEMMMVTMEMVTVLLLMVKEVVMVSMVLVTLVVMVIARWQ